MTVWGTFSRHALSPFIPLDHGLNPTGHLNITADLRDHYFPSSNGRFWPSDDAPRPKAKAASNWLPDRDDEFGVLPWPSRASDLNPGGHVWDVEERESRGMKMHRRNLPQEPCV